jgi:glutathione S-transferase
MKPFTPITVLSFITSAHRQPSIPQSSLNMGGYNSNIGTNPTLPLQFFAFPNNTCPYAQRTHITLLELDIPFDLQTVNKGEDWYRKINPLGKVPALRVPSSMDVLYESAICNEYLCDLALESNGTTSASTLMPNNAMEKAQIRLLNHYCDALGKAQFTFLMNKDEDKEERLVLELNKALQVYEDALISSGGPFLRGKDFTLADVHVFPFLQRLIITLGHFKKYEIPSTQFPLLLKWFDLCLERDSVQKSSMSREKTIEVYSVFVNSNYDFGGLNTNDKNK